MISFPLAVMKFYPAVKKYFDDNAEKFSKAYGEPKEVRCVSMELYYSDRIEFYIPLGNVDSLYLAEKPIPKLKSA